MERGVRGGTPFIKKGKKMYKELTELVEKSNKIVFFGGAGVSTESGVPDFRSADGLYSMKFEHPPEVMLSKTFFKKHPEKFYDFYRTKMLYEKIEPNVTHHTLAKLEDAGKLTAIVTQNIDGLHQKAGSKNVLELHGSVLRNYCVTCNQQYNMEAIKTEGVPRCECGGIIRPDVVLFEESLNSYILDLAVNHVQESDLLIVGGTSLVVYPAASLVSLCKGKVIIINNSETSYDYQADLVVRGGIGEAFNAINTLVNFLN